MVPEDAPDLGVEEAVGQRHGEALGGQQQGPQVLEQAVGEAAGVAGPQDGDDVGDAQQGDDHQQGLGGLPVLVVGGLAALPGGPGGVWG